MEGGIEVKGREGRGLKQLLNDLKEKIKYWKLKEETPDRTLWRSRLEEAMNLSCDRVLSEHALRTNLRINSNCVQHNSILVVFVLFSVRCELNSLIRVKYEFDNSAC